MDPRPKATEFGEITQRVSAITPFKDIQGHRFWYRPKAHNKKCDFLLVINTNIPPILHRSRDRVFDRYKIAIFGLLLPLTFNPHSTDGFSWDDLRKIFRGSQRMAKVPNGIVTLPKISSG